MDDLLRDFLTESAENLQKLDQDLIELEQRPHDLALVHSIFRTIHTIKGTCGFIGLPRLEVLAHVTESVLGAEHPEVANFLNALALIQLPHDPKAAQTLADRALAISLRTKGPQHPVTALSLYILGTAQLEAGACLLYTSPSPRD